MSVMRQRMEAALAAAFDNTLPRVGRGADAAKADRRERMRRFLEAAKDGDGDLPAFVNAGMLSGLFRTTTAEARAALEASDADR
ncbi:MAG TPA: hypothetical protein VM619_04090 [Luteimonas sp.]|nr:hypothetical protein [Luteimonas sp.]